MARCSYRDCRRLQVSYVDESDSCFNAGCRGGYRRSRRDPFGYEYQAREVSIRIDRPIGLDRTRIVVQAGYYWVSTEGMDNQSSGTALPKRAGRQSQNPPAAPVFFFAPTLMNYRGGRSWLVNHPQGWNQVAPESPNETWLPRPCQPLAVPHPCIRVPRPGPAAVRAPCGKA